MTSMFFVALIAMFLNLGMDGPTATVMAMSVLAALNLL